MNDKPETPSEVKKRDAKYWLDEIQAAKDRNSDWYEKAEEAEERYRDEDARAFGSLNIFWANVETQKAAIGEEFGKPQVTRVNAPENDGGLSRKVAEVWERSIAAAVRDTKDNHDIKLAVDDVFVPGLGTLWVELDVKENDAGDVMWVSAPIVRVPYADFLTGPATRWGDVPWVARGHRFTRDELVSECGMSDEKAEAVPLNVSLPDKGRKNPSPGKGQEQFRRARVWEIWTKFPQKARLFVAEGYTDDALCYDKDPFRLKDFFPCPRPMQANGPECEPPLTDFSRYEDQAKELDQICQRIFVLTAVLRRRGVHDKAFKEMADLALANDNVSLAVENWAELTQKGGLAAVMMWEDLAPTIGVLVELHKQRRELIELIYELSGISDLARGMTDPQETLGAQKLKASFGAGRFRAREVESRRLAAEAYAIKGELVAEKFPREQLAEMSGIALPTEKEIAAAKDQLQKIVRQYQVAQQTGIQLPPPNQEQVRILNELANTRFSWDRISGVLRSDYRRCYSVEVETDQTKFVDEEADKKARSEFFSMVMQSMQTVGPMIAGNPKVGEVWKQLIMFVIASFKAGRGMEEGIERVIDEAIEKAGQQGQQQQPDPKAAADAQVAQARVQTAQVGLQTAQVRLQEAQVKAQAAGADVQAEAQKMQLKAVESRQKVQAQHDKNAAARTGQQIENIGRAEKLAFEAETRATAQEALLKGPTQAPNGAPA